MSSHNAPQQLAADLVQTWRRADVTPSASATLLRHPSLAYDRSFVVDLAYSEYALKTERGEHIAIDEFCAGFGSFADAVRRQIAIDECYRNQFDNLTWPLPDRWPLAGDAFSHFRLIEELGRGGLARVYLAQDDSLYGREVVLKITPRVSNEAEQLVKFNHVGISPIYSVVEDASTEFVAICMPFVSRFTLADFIAKRDSKGDRFQHVLSRLYGRQIDPFRNSPASFRDHRDSLVRFGELLADALAHAHARGVLHLDLKPSNVLLTPDGSPLLIDFNLAADLHSATFAGGTPAYMAPEQLAFVTSTANEKQLDARADIYSFGLLMYQLATGIHPLCGSGAISWNAAEISEFQQCSEQSPTHYNAVDGAFLRGVIRECLAIDPADRIQEAAELAKRFRRQSDLPARAIRSVCRRPRRVFVAAIAAAGLAAVPFVVVQPLLARNARRESLHAFERGDLAACRDLLESLPDDPKSNAFRGLVYYRLGDFRKARLEFDKASHAWKDPRLYILEASCNARDGRFAVAVDVYQTALNFGVKTPELYSAIGACWYSLNEFTRAKQYFLDALALDSSCAPALYYLAANELRVSLPERRPVKLRYLEDIRQAGTSMPDESCIPYLGASLAAQTDLPDEEKRRQVRAFLEEAARLGISFEYDPFDPAEYPEILPPSGIAIPPAPTDSHLIAHKFDLFSASELLDK